MSASPHLRGDTHGQQSRRHFTTQSKRSISSLAAADDIGPRCVPYDMRRRWMIGGDACGDCAESMPVVSTWRLR